MIERLMPLKQGAQQAAVRGGTVTVKVVDGRRWPVVLAGNR